MLAPYSEAAEGGPLLDFAIRSLDLFDEFVARVEEDSGMRVGYERSGTLHVARSDQSLESLAALQRAISTRSAASQLMSAAEVRSHEPQLAADVFGGLLI